MNIFKKLSSLRFTIFLIISLIVIFIIGLIVPQKELLGRDMYLAWKNAKPGFVSFLEFLGLTDIYTSPVTLILWALFSLNLLTVILNRIPLIWKSYKKVNIPGSIEAVKNSRQFEVINGMDMNYVRNRLRKSGYRTFIKENAFRAVKNRFSPLATILFHLSFFLLLIGAVMNVYTEFRAETNVAVGETFTGQYRWVKGPKIGSVPKTTFTVEEIVPTYYKKDFATDLKVVLSTKRGKEIIGVNKPYKEGNLSFIVSDIDISPLFIIKDANGKEVEGAYVKLIVLNGREDSFKMLGFKFRTIFYTDYSDKTKKDSEVKAVLPQILKVMPMVRNVRQPREIVNPAFKIMVFRDNVFIAEKTIKQGEYIEFDGYRLKFEDLTYWAKFYVGKEHGLGILYTSFIFMLMALVVRFVFFRRDIKGLVVEGSLYIGGSGEFYPVLFEDEFKRMVNSLKV
ncbi:MAG: cytochrome c biogenesis protein ResB [Nitrospirota bacterium]